MLKMVDRQTIIHMYRVQKMSRRVISGELDCNRETVNKTIIVSKCYRNEEATEKEV